MPHAQNHWREYLIEAVCLGAFMLSAAGAAVLLQHPVSPLLLATPAHWPQRAVMGVAMGLTLVLIVYSPLGRRSGAHMNPALTLAFLRLGKIDARDAAGYVAGQFAGGVGGILVADWLYRGLPAHPAVNYVATVPGPAGPALAFLAEAVISLGMMLLVLHVSNTPRVARLTGLCAGALVAAYITLEAPLSGMSMNPARTLGPALLSHTTSSLWIYFVAPLAGMLAGAEIFVRWHGPARVRCAKLDHPPNVRCIFRCGFKESAA